jgi:hypothetical protein
LRKKELGKPVMFLKLVPEFSITSSEDGITAEEFVA